MVFPGLKTNQCCCETCNCQGEAFSVTLAPPPEVTQERIDAVCDCVINECPGILEFVRRSGYSLHAIALCVGREPNGTIEQAVLHFLYTCCAEDYDQDRSEPCFNSAPGEDPTPADARKIQDLFMDCIDDICGGSQSSDGAQGCECSNSAGTGWCDGVPCAFSDPVVAELSIKYERPEWECCLVGMEEIL